MENTSNKTKLIVLSCIVLFLVIGFMFKPLAFGEGKTKQLYNKNQEYQAYTAKTKNTAKTLDEVTIEYISEANTVALSFPTNQPNPVGTVTFFHPSKTNKDRVFELKTDPSKRMYIRVDDYEKGIWRVKVAWQGEDKLYVKEDKINLQPNDWSRPIHK
jgi:FixH